MQHCNHSFISVTLLFLPDLGWCVKHAWSVTPFRQLNGTFGSFWGILFIQFHKCLLRNIDNPKCLRLIWHAGSNLQDSGLLSFSPRSSNTDALGRWSAWREEPEVLVVLTVLQRRYKTHQSKRVVKNRRRDRGRDKEGAWGYEQESPQDIKTWFDREAWSCSTALWFVNQVFELCRLELLLTGRSTFYPPLSFYETSASLSSCIIIYEAVYSSVNVRPRWSDHKGTAHHFTPGIRRLSVSDQLWSDFTSPFCVNKHVHYWNKWTMSLVHEEGKKKKHYIWWR